MTPVWQARGRPRSDKGGVPLHFRLTWWTLLVVADVLFYLVLAPVWIGLRLAAWAAELRARGRRS